MSPNKPPRIPQPVTFLRRRSIPSSTFSKPKSRFVEQTLPPIPCSAEDCAPLSSLDHGRAKTPLTAREEEEEDEKEEEIYKREQYPMSRNRRRWKFRNLIEWLIFVSAMACLITSLVFDRVRNFVIWGLEIWKWGLMVAVICCGRLVTDWFITVLVFLVERNFLLKKKLLYFVCGLKNIVRICIWLGLVLLSCSLLFHSGVDRSPKTVKVLHLVSRALISLLIGSVIWLVKTLLVKILASSFHMNRFFDRIQESIFHQYVLQTLSVPLVMELGEEVGVTKSSGQLIIRSMGKGKGKEGEEQGVIDVAKLHKMRREKVSSWTMKGLIDVIRSSGLSTPLNTIDESFDEEKGEQRDREITSEWEAQAAAYRIFKNVAKPSCK